LENDGTCSKLKFRKLLDPLQFPPSMPGQHRASFDTQDIEAIYWFQQLGSLQIRQIAGNHFEYGPVWVTV
jgi:hypothetical protein